MKRVWDTANCDRSRVCCPKRRLRPEKSRIKVSGSLWPSNLGFADLRTDPIANMDVSNGETDRRDFFSEGIDASGIEDKGLRIYCSLKKI